MKKRLALTLTLMLTVSLLTACTDEDDNSIAGDTPPVDDDVQAAEESQPVPTPDDINANADDIVSKDGYVAYADFETGGLMGFGVRGTADEQNSGVGVLTVSRDVARSGEYSLLITERKSAWNGPAIRIENLIELNVQYDISVWVHAKTPDTSEFILSTQIGDGSGAQYINLEKKNVNVSDGWVEFTAQHTYTDVSDFITVYVENSNKDAEFYIDDFTMASGGATWTPGVDPITSNWIGSFDGFDVEFWADKSNAGTMILTGGGTYTCSWESGNILFRTGKKLGSVMPYGDYGDIVMEYDGTHNITSGAVSYFTVYGWTEDPLVEWYIVENHGSYRPGKDLAGQIEVDGGIYNVYTDTRVEQPSIQGTKTFLQIYSIRTEGRTEGTITVSDHFEGWKNLGLDVSGNLYEVTLCIEGYQSKGDGSVTKLELTIGDEVYK